MIFLLALRGKNRPDVGSGSRSPPMARRVCAMHWYLRSCEIELNIGSLPDEQQILDVQSLKALECHSPNSVDSNPYPSLWQLPSAKIHAKAMHYPEWSPTFESSSSQFYLSILYHSRASLISPQLI